MTPELLAECREIVALAGQMVRERWNRPRTISHKGQIDLVTDTDRAVEDYLRDKLGRLLPEAGFLGEESALNQADALKNGLCWVVDPVDGTTNFVHRIPMVGISVALCEAGEPVLGVVEAPMLAETYTALKGHGSCCNSEPVRVSRADRLVDSLVATGFPYEVAPQLERLLGRLAAVLPATQGLRRPGAASIDLAWVGCGRLDVFYEDGLKPWDMAAGWLFVTEAGGKVTDFTGAPAGFGKSLLASNGIVHADFVELLKLP